jgi:DNA-binding beta-propeller fold protein YncE
MPNNFGYLRPVAVLGALLALPVAAHAEDAADASESSHVVLGRAPRLLIDLPPTVCNTPDGMRLDPRRRDVILACPNIFGQSAPGVFLAAPALMRISGHNRLEPYFSALPAPAHSPNRAAPAGIDFGPDGNLYVADAQFRYDPNYKSRLLRVNVDRHGRPRSADVVVEGLRLANAVMWNHGYVYVSDTWAYEEAGRSALYRFSRTELARATTANPIRIQKPTATSVDPHLFASFTTIPGRGINLAGANGITFDRAGNLYTGNFGDGVITKITFDRHGNKASQTTLPLDPKLTCVDGITYDRGTDKIFVADSQKNAIQIVSPRHGTVTTLWENDDTNGAGGLLDQPSESVIRGRDLIIANFDGGFPPTAPAKNRAHDAPHTISVIRIR